MAVTLPPSKVQEFRKKLRLIQSTASLPTLFGVFGYMLLLTDLAAAEWATWWFCLVVYGVVVGLVLEGRSRRELRPILHFLDADEGNAAWVLGADEANAARVLGADEGNAARVLDADEGNAARILGAEGGGLDRAALARPAFAAIAALPIRLQRREFVVNFLPALIFPILMELSGYAGWLEWERLRTYVFASFVGSLFSAGLIFYWAKHSFVDLRGRLAQVMGDPNSRASLVERRSLVQKIRFAVTMPALASVLLVVNVVYDSLRLAANENAIDWSEAALAVVADADGSLPLHERVDLRLPDREFWPTALEFVEIPASGLAAGTSGDFSASFREALEGSLGHRAVNGRLAPSVGEEVGAYRRLADGSVLVAVARRGEFAFASGAMNRAVALVCLAMAIGALVIGALVCQDLRSALALLRDEVDRMASGDLRPGRVFESEDELGDLGRAFEAMGDSLRATVGRVHGAADRVERTAGDVTSVVSALASGTREQFDRIRQATELMLSIDAQVRAVSESAQGLHESVDASNDSVVQLGAAGDELNRTASVLSTKADAVSESIENMVRNVKEVGLTTERLAEVSEETSSSMEEMASSMRLVDDSAAATADLSRVVVEKAELGQSRVSQTIEGMDAIRQATETAERVIRGLGARTSEIGGILDVIDDVADETNLLALNAAIIAAQAGEHGRAFSVVAEEIKDLADRVLASTKEIGGLIRAVQDESENAIGAIEAGSQSVMSGVALSAEAGRTLEEITETARESGGRIAEIVSSVREQTRAASHVAALMERVREAADQISAAGSDQDRSHEVVYRSALTMREVVQQVNGTTAEQSEGFGRIRENVEGVRATVEQINRTLQEQSLACGEVAGFLEQVFEGTRSNESAASTMRGATRELLAQAEALREDAECFRIS